MTYKLFNILRELIPAHDTIIIHRHQNPDPDAIGSQVGLAHMLKATYPSKKVLVASDDTTNLDKFITVNKARYEDYENALVIVTDTANKQRIEGSWWSKGSTLIKIDHHPEEQEGCDYADYTWVDTTYSSASEMIAQMWLENEYELEMNAQSAEMLYMGIVGDTGRFMFPNTSSRTHYITSRLVEYDFDHTELLQRINERTVADVNLMKLGLQNMKFEGSVVSACVSLEEMQREGIDQPNTHLITAALRDISNVSICAVFMEIPDEEKYKVSIRSKGPVINQVANAHGGGGHTLAAGAIAEDLDEVQEIIDELNSLVD